MVRDRGAGLPRCAGDRAGPPGRQLDGRTDRDRARLRRPRAGCLAEPARPRAGLPAPARARPAGPAPAPGAGGLPAPAPRGARARPFLGPVRATGAARPGDRRHRRGAVLPQLPLARRPGRVLRRSPQHLPRRAARGERLLRAARGPRAARAVRLGRAGPRHPAGLRPPRRRSAAGGPADRAPRLRARAPGRAPRADQPPDPPADRLRLSSGAASPVAAACSRGPGAG